MGPSFKPIVKIIPYESPLTCFKRIFHSSPAFLLESARENPQTGRYSFLGSDPYLIVEAREEKVWVQRKGKLVEIFKGNPFLVLQSLLKSFNMVRPIGLPPFFGGAVGFFGYDMVHHFENLSRRSKETLPIVDCLLLFVDTVIVFDHFKKTGQIIYFPSPEELEGRTWETLIKSGENKISYYTSLIESSRQDARFGGGERSPDRPSNLMASQAFPGRNLEISSSISKSAFKDKVLQCKEYIKAGDIFQANLSQRFMISPLNSPPLTLYETLRTINPASFSAFLDAGDFQLVSSSPERLVSLNRGSVNTRPIAGTHPRGKNAEEDNKMRSALLSNEKERAEHMMLIDLERNDLGKICEYGSIKADEIMGLESYSHVIHIVSNICGKLKSPYGWYDIIKAVFPGGTITGVPKIRAMEIIDELEPVRRGAYTGSLGYISFSGELDLNILIRTLVVIGDKGYIQTGAGIVADSIPEKEYEETVQKALALFKAINFNPS